METGYWVVMENEGGELDRKFATDRESAKAALVALIEECEYIDHGDSFRIVEGQSER